MLFLQQLNELGGAGGGSYLCGFFVGAFLWFFFPNIQGFSWSVRAVLSRGEGWERWGELGTLPGTAGSCCAKPDKSCEAPDAAFLAEDRVSSWLRTESPPCHALPRNPPPPDKIRLYIPAVYKVRIGGRGRKKRGKKKKPPLKVLRPSFPSWSHKPQFLGKGVGGNKRHTNVAMLFIGIRRIHKDSYPPGRRSGPPPPVHRTPPPHAAHTHPTLPPPPPTNPPDSFYDGYFFSVKLPNKSALAPQRGERRNTHSLYNGNVRKGHKTYRRALTLAWFSLFAVFVFIFIYFLQPRDLRHPPASLWMLSVSPFPPPPPALRKSLYYGN